MSGTRSDGIRRRDELLDAALRCFAERGIVNTGIEDIRKAASASPSSVYNLFEGLPGLIVALLTRTFDRLSVYLTARVATTASAETAVRSLVEGQLQWVFDHEDEARFMYQAMALEVGAEDRRALAAIKSRLFAPIYAHLEQFVARGELPRWPADAFGIVLLGPCHEMCRRYLAGDDLDPEWMQTMLPNVAWKSVGGQAVARRTQA